MADVQVAALAFALVLLAPVAAAGGEACASWSVRSAVGLGMSAQECAGGRSWAIGADDPDGRTSMEWYEDERGAGIAAHRAPRFVMWSDGPDGCAIVVYAAGATEIPCALGPPPPPPHVPR